MFNSEVTRELQAIKEDVQDKKIFKYEVYYYLQVFCKYQKLDFSQVFQHYYSL